MSNQEWATQYNFARRNTPSITESRPLKHVGRKKWGTQDALRAHKGLPPFSVPFDF